MDKIEKIQERALRFLYDDHDFSYEELLGKSQKCTMHVNKLRYLCIEIIEIVNPKIWNSLSSDLKSANYPNTFKHKIKENFFQNIQKEEDDIYVFYQDPSSSLPTMFPSHKPFSY